MSDLAIAARIGLGLLPEPAPVPAQGLGSDPSTWGFPLNDQGLYSAVGSVVGGGLGALIGGQKHRWVGIGIGALVGVVSGFTIATARMSKP